MIDYSIPEPFPFASASRGPANEEIVHDAVDRTSFDKVINGIVANPDFSRSYPPTSSTTSSPIPSRRKIPSNPSSLHDHIPQRINDKARPNQALDSSLQLRPKYTNNTSTISTAITSSTTASISTKKDGANQTVAAAADAPTSHLDNLSSDHGSVAPPLVGPDSMTINNLFEFGLNESSKIASECLDCICDASSNCIESVQCISQQREKNRCGLYMISWNQFKESDISLTTSLNSASSSNQKNAQDYEEKLYYECTTDKDCAEKLIHLYIEKHLKDCNNDGKVDCHDIAAIHRVGPEQCNSGKFLISQYWKDFNTCYTNTKATTIADTSSSTSTTR